MRFEEYRQHDAVSLAGLIAKRQVSAKEVLEVAIGRAEQVNPAINAIVHKQYEQARKAIAAGLPEGPLKGVPSLIKALALSHPREPAHSARHVVSRSVGDSARMLDCTAGPEPGDPYAAPPQERSFLEAITRPPRKLRIALMLKDHRGVELHPECLEAVQSAAKLCASLGHVVEEADPALDMAALRPMNA